MSEQEMQFADPDWKPRQTTPPAHQVYARPVNSVRAAQPVDPVDAGKRAYREGYTGAEYPEIDNQAQPQRGYVQPQPQRRRGSPPWLVIGIIVFAVIFVIGLAQGYVSSRGFSGGPAIDHISQLAKPQHGFPFRSGQQFKVGSFPTLNVVDLSGSINVVAGGAADVVTVQPDQSNSFFGGNGPFQSSTIQASQSDGGSTLTINVNANSSDSTDVTLTVPQDITLHLQTQDGDISISGVTGQMTLKSGDGDIALDDVTLQQHSSIQTDSGDIDFAGAIDPKGTYQLTSNSGDITVGLDGGTPYHLHAISQSGTFTGNGAASSFSSGDGNGINQQGNVGNNPQASLTLQTQSGDIDLTS